MRGARREREGWARSWAGPFHARRRRDSTRSNASMTRTSDTLLRRGCWTREKGAPTQRSLASKRRVTLLTTVHPKVNYFREPIPRRVLDEEHAGRMASHFSQYFLRQPRCG